MVNSIKKGKNFERKIAFILSQHFKIPFQRVPSSGGINTLHNISNAVLAGDIFTENNSWNSNFNVVIECKTIGKQLTITDLVSEKGIIKSWINQCDKECMGKKWWLIFSFNNASYNFIITSDNKNVVMNLTTFLNKCKNEVV